MPPYNTIRQLTFLILLLLFLGISLSAQTFQHRRYDYQTTPKALNDLKNKANEYYDKEDYSKAIEIYQQLIEQCFALGYKEYVVDLYEYITDIIANSTDAPITHKIKQIEFYCNSEKRIDLKAVKYAYWAQAHLSNNNIDSANFYYNIASKHCLTDNLWLVKVNLDIGFSYIYYIFYGNLRKTLEYIKKAEKTTKEFLLPKKITPSTNLYVMQANVYTSLGYKEKAIQANIAIIDLIKKDKSTSSSSLVDQYHTLAIQYDGLEDVDNAILYYKKEIELVKKYNLKQHENIYYPSYCIAGSYVKQGKNKQALEIYTRMLQRLQKEKLPLETRSRYLIESYQGIAKVYANINLQDSVAHYLDKLYKIHQHSNYQLYSTDLLASNYYVDVGNYLEAQQRIQKHIKKAKNETKIDTKQREYDIHAMLSSIHFEKGDYKKAMDYSQASLRILAPNFSAYNSYDNPSFKAVYHKDMLIKTLSTKLKVLEALYNQKAPNTSPDLLLSTIKLIIKALEYKNKNFNSKSSQIYWLNQQAIPIFEVAIRIVLNLHQQTKDPKYLNEAFMLSEKSKSIMMMNALQEQSATSFGGIPQDLIDRERELEREFKVIEKAKQDAEMSNDEAEVHYQDSLLFDYNHEKNTLLEHFENNYPKYYELKYVVHQTSIKDVQAVLDENTILIEYFQGKENVYVFTISDQEAFVHSFERNKLYDVKLSSFLKKLLDFQLAKANINKSCRIFTKNSYLLYQKLIEKSLLPNKKHLILIPDGKLAYLPFEVLLSEKGKQTQEQVDFSKLPYLINEYTTSYNFSAQLFLQQYAQRKPNQTCKVLALAPSYSNKTAPEWRNPDEQKIRQGLRELPGAVRELEFLEQFFKGDFLYEEDANEANFKTKVSDYGILHLAVHGLLDEEKPELSGLILEENNSRTEDNILYDYEIKQLDLQAQLVVLSACETGIGKYQSGEGVMSIGRGFMYAGVPSLVTTLWELNDYSGNIIIQALYKNLQKGLPKDEALRLAKLHYLNKHNGVAAHPAFWACMVQVGDYTPLGIYLKNGQWPYFVIGILVLLVGVGVFIKMKKK